MTKRKKRILTDEEQAVRDHRREVYSARNVRTGLPGVRMTTVDPRASRPRQSGEVEAR